MTFATAVPISFTSFVYCTNVYWSVIHGIKRKPHLSVVWNWYHFVAIAILHQPRPTDSVDINTRLQLSDTSSIPPMHGGFLLGSVVHWGDVAAAGFCEPREDSFIEVAVGGETWPDVSSVGFALAVRPLLHGLLLVLDDPLDLGLATAEGCCDGSSRLAAIVSLDDLDQILKSEDLAIARHNEVVESLMIVKRMWQPCIYCGLYPHSMEGCHIISQWNALTQP